MEILSMIVAAAVTHGVDPNLLKAVCYKETRWRNVVVHDNKSKSYGACQVKQIAAKEVGLPSANLNEPETSIQIGAMYLKRKLNECPNTLKAIGAYNTGKCIIPKGKYVDDVIKLYEEFKNEE